MDPVTNIDILALAAVGGFIPALVWLWFWLREDAHPEPWQYLSLVFVLGMIAVPLVIPFQQAIQDHLAFAPIIMFVLWAALEEVFKFGAAYFAALKSPVNDEPVDPVIYMITAALGFAALENTLYLIDPLSQQLIADSVVITNLRFVGATLLHVVSSAIIGLFLAFSFYKPRAKRTPYLLAGLLLATTLHAVFNIALMQPGGEAGMALSFGMTWVGALMLVILFERVKKL